MKDSVANLEKKFASVKTTKKKIEILLELAYHFHRKDGNRSLSYAKTALSLAEASQDIPQTVNCLIRAGDAYFFLGDYASSLQAHERAADLCDVVGDDIRKSTVYIWMSMPLVALLQHQRALEILNLAFTIQQKNDHTIASASTLQKIAVIHYKFSDYAKALELCRQGVTLLKDESHARKEVKLIEALLLGTIARIYNELQEYDKALEVHSKEFNIYVESGDLYGQSTALGNTAITYKEMGKLDKALSYFQKGLNIQKQLHQYAHEAESLSLIAGIHTSLGNHEVALKNSELAIQAISKVDNVFIKRIVILQHGKVLNAIGRSDDALKFLFESLSYMKDGNKQVDKCEALEQISLAYEQIGDKGKALEYFKQLLELKVDLLKKQTDKDLKLLEARLTTEKYEAEKEVYRLKAEQLEKENIIRSNEVTSLGLQVIQKNEFLMLLRKKAKEILVNGEKSGRSVRSFVKEIEERLDSENAQKLFNDALSNLHDEFESILRVSYPTLTKTERKVCSLIKLDITSQEIAELLFTSIRTVEGHRLNIRKKLSIPNQQDIKLFLLSISP